LSHEVNTQESLTMPSAQIKGRVTTPDGVLVREISGESVLLNLNSESYFGLDAVGTRMWAALAASPSIESAYEALLNEYDVEPEHLRADLAAFIEKLAQLGLVEVCDV
jgi:hypothetical protein